MIDAPALLLVLQSFPVPRPTTNPYLVMLARSIDAVPGVSVLNFTWQTALLGRYDVFHVHWPEILVSGQSPAKKLVRQLLFALLVLRLSVTRTPIVRTVHNLELPKGISRREVLLLRLAERMTTLRIRLNHHTELPAGLAVETILHGHYRDWFAAHPHPEPIPGRIAYFGLIRSYKGVDGLLAAFSQTTDRALSLRVAGRPSTQELADDLTRLAAPDDRISLSLEFLTDAALVDQVGGAELVVLPYREMHNSGGALTTLSLDRPVLLPDNEVNRALAAEVGAGWVLLYDGDLTAASLEESVGRVRRTRGDGRPDLTGRDWGRAGADHVTAYRAAIRLRRERGRFALARTHGWSRLR